MCDVLEFSVENPVSLHEQQHISNVSLKVKTLVQIKLALKSQVIFF